jgi:hypothetical protein
MELVVLIVGAFQLRVVYVRPCTIQLPTELRVINGTTNDFVDLPWHMQELSPSLEMQAGYSSVWFRSVMYLEDGLIFTWDPILDVNEATYIATQSNNQSVSLMIVYNGTLSGSIMPGGGGSIPTYAPETRGKLEFVELTSVSANLTIAAPGLLSVVWNYTSVLTFNTGEYTHDDSNVGVFWYETNTIPFTTCYWDTITW